MAFVLRAVSRPNITGRASAISIASFRGISGEIGFDKYFAPYPTLPQVKPSEQTKHVEPRVEGTYSIYQDLTNRLGMDLTGSAEERWETAHLGASRLSRKPGNVYAGRSIAVSDRTGNDVSTAYRRLHVILARNRVRSEQFLRKRYEKPSDRERRLRSDRHRRRFASWIREKVQLVSEIRRRG